MAEKVRRRTGSTARRAGPPGKSAPPPPGDIAIIGMACLFPGAPDLPTYWRNILSKVDAITDPPSEAWDTRGIYDPDSTENDRTYCQRGGFIAAHAWFDALQHHVMPVAVEGGEPEHWLAFHVARAALADAGYADQVPDRHRAAVILGKGNYLSRGAATITQHVLIVDQTLEILRTMHPEFTDADLRKIRQELKRSLPPFNADTAPALIPNVIVGRIANRLDLMGPSYTVDAACASFVVAVDAAVRSLRSGEIDVALVGGVHAVTPPPIIALFAQLGALSRREKIRPFDRQADGTILGEGIGMVVLRRREDAEREGRRIYALIKGVGVASDGRGLGVLAPRLEGEVAALERAYANAGVSPRTVGLVEGHGTGTPAGDVVELKALRQVFGERTGALPWCAVGSVKSMIGHLMPAAGAAGLIKAALALHHQVLPPTLNVDEPNPEMDLDRTPFYINREVRPWIHAASDAPRRAGVNAFGFGGINTHVVLEEYPQPGAPSSRSHCPPWDSEVLILSAPSRPELAERARHVQRFLRAAPDTEMKDLAYTLNVPVTAGRERLAIVASTVEDALHKLERAVDQLGDPRCHQIRDVQGIYYFENPLAGPGRVAFLFPGEGSQYIDMLADLCIHLPEVRKHFETVDRVLAAEGRQLLLSDLVFPPAGFTAAERRSAEERLSQMEGAVEAVVTANRALFGLLGRLGIRPDAVLGHSSGEYSALLASGMIQLSDETAIASFVRDLYEVYADATVEGEIPRAVLVAVGAGIDTVRGCMDAGHDGISVAMDNCPHQTVIIGAEEAIGPVVGRLRERGVICERLSFDRPYHTPMFEGFAKKLEAFFGRWLSSPGEVPTYSCTTASRFPADVGACRTVAVAHWMRPVEFRKTIEAMYADGIRVFIESGPRGNLTSFVSDILRGRPHLAVAANVMSRTGITQLNHLVGTLAAQGLPTELDVLYADRSPLSLDLGRTSEAVPPGRRASSRIKLLTAWPRMRVPEETSAGLRGSSAPAPGTAHLPAPGATTASEPAQPPTRAATGPPGPVAPPVDGQARHRAGSLPVTRATPPPASGSRHPSMSAYLRTMEQFLAVQEDVLQAFLARGASPAEHAAPLTLPSVAKGRPEGPGAAAPPAASPVSAPSMERVRAEPPAPPPAPVAPATAAAVQAILLELVSERTGYPAEMLDLEVDLEADLGIDSIKRVEILGALQRRLPFFRTEDTEALTGKKTLQQVISFLTGTRDERDGVPPGAPARATTPPALPATGPLIGTIVSSTPGAELIARREFTLEEDRFLMDHTLGHRISVTDPDLHGLPVVPLTISMEMMVAAGSMLSPGLEVLGLRDVRAYRWAALEDDRLVVTLLARRDPHASSEEVRVWIHEGERATTSGGPSLLAEGTVILGPRLPDAPAAGDFRLTGERPSGWAPEQLYAGIMFHGPMFRGVVSVDRTGDDGAVATLEVQPRRGLFRSIPEPILRTDPVLLDQPGQVVAFWAAEHLDAGYVVFPFQVERLLLYGRPLPDGERLECRARVTVVDQHQLRSNLEAVTADRRLWARFEGWWNRRFHLPPRFSRALASLRDEIFCAPWSPPLPEPTLSCCRLGIEDLPAEFSEAHGGFWQRVVALLVLSRREREAWRDLRGPAARRTEWLMGRVAAKDAVRRFIKAQHGIALCAADVEIWPDEHGQPLATGVWLSQVPRAPMVSLSHSDRFAVAVAGPFPVGVDVELARPLGRGADDLAFTPAERALLSAIEVAPDEYWALRLWCAKEAAAKALGHGMVGGPQALVVTDRDLGTGIVTVTLAGSMAERFPRVQAIRVYTAREADVIVATAVYEPEGER